MALKLIELTYEYKDALIEMISEWKKDIEENHTNHSPYAIFKNSTDDFDYYLANLSSKNPKGNLVPDSTLFLLDEERNRLIGACNIRHYLNDDLLLYGGHIGDGIRPSERRKGYGTKLIALALKYCKDELHIDRVLITCHATNIGSRKAIIANGGIKENEVLEDGEILERYWVEMK